MKRRDFSLFNLAVVIRNGEKMSNLDPVTVSCIDLVFGTETLHRSSNSRLAPSNPSFITVTASFYTQIWLHNAKPDFLCLHYVAQH